jgi:hypothetical protein
VSDEKRLPFVDAALVEYVTTLFPNRVPAIDATDREIWASVGAQRVVAKLRSLAAMHSNNILNRDILSHND